MPWNGQTTPRWRALSGCLARLRWETENPEAHRQAVDEALEVAERLAPGEDRAWVANLAAEASMLEGDTASSRRVGGRGDGGGGP